MAKKLRVKKTATKKTVTAKKGKAKKTLAPKATAKKTTSAKKVAKKKPTTALTLLEQIEARVKASHGEESIMKLTGEIKAVPVAFSTGVEALNRAIGIGGYPKGRIIEIFGPESSGKTTLALHAIAECQKAGGVCTFVDAEHALDVLYAKALGVDMSRLMVSQPDSGEQGLQIVQDTLDVIQTMSTTIPNVIVVDSVAALTPQSEIDGDIGGGSGVGEQARIMSKAMRKLVGLVAKTNTVLIFINQTRAAISFGYGPKTTTCGGNALKFYASIRIDIRRIGSEKSGDEILGNKTKVKVIKNKVAPPFKEFEGLIRFGVGFDTTKMEYDSLCEVEGVVKKKPAWVTLPDGRKFCGYKGFLDFTSTEDNANYVKELLKGE